MTGAELIVAANRLGRAGRHDAALKLRRMAEKKLAAENAWLDAQLADIRAENERYAAELAAKETP